MRGLLSSRRQGSDELEEDAADVHGLAGEVEPAELGIPGPRFLGRHGRPLRGQGRGGVEAFTTSTSTRLFLALIVAAVVAGPTALLVQLAQPAAAPVAAPAAPAASAVGPASRAGSAATQLVRFWLSAGPKDRDQLVALVLVPPQTLPLPVVRPRPPSWVEAADVSQTAAGEWRVLVRAGGGLAGRMATYLVLVEVGDTDAKVVALPARVGVAEPAVPAVSNLDAVRLSDPAAETVAGFATALLTGDVDLSRWTSPDSLLQPGPKACQAVSVTQVLSSTSEPAPTNGNEVTVLATVNCTIVNAGLGRPQADQSLQYPLILRARDGRWEVVRYADSTSNDAAASDADRPTGVGPASATPPTSSPAGR